jgi:purine-nucleoside phosphorylase
MSADGKEAAARVRAATDLPFAFGMILGSGLGHLADAVDRPVRIPYAELPGFPEVSVSSHAGALVAGTFEGVPVAVLAGRAHYYESGDPAVMRPAIGMLKQLGCHSLIVTNAAGAVRETIAPGGLMLIADHINFSGRSPLIGVKGDERFVGLTNAYDPALKGAFFAAAAEEDITVEDGVYAWLSGPSFETPAEIRALRILGADAVGMSTVPEVILARYYGLRVLAVSVITNYAAGMTGLEISHQETKHVAPLGAAKLERVIRRLLRDYRPR